MKIIKVIIVLLSVCFSGLVLYANLRTLSLSQKVKKAQLASFQLTGTLSDSVKTELEYSLSATHGVTACTINNESNIAAVVFYKKDISEPELMHLLSYNGTLSVHKNDLASGGGGCPVPKVEAAVNRFISALDFRQISLSK